MPGSEIYTALALNTIDASNYGGPTSFYNFSVHEVAKYWIDPPSMPYQETGTLVNPESWNALPDDLKDIMDIWGRYIWQERAVRYINKDFESLAAMMEQGVTHITWDAEDLQVLVDTAKPIWEELGNADANSREMVDLVYKYEKLWGYS
jgi:TRAP-type mannitol/chloroaromatic compound transport system substrate-binding protein